MAATSLSGNSLLNLCHSMWQMCLQGGIPCQICVAQCDSYGPKGEPHTKCVAVNVADMVPGGNRLQLFLSQFGSSVNKG